MARKVIHDVIAENKGGVKSEMLDDENTRPNFLSRKREVKGRITKQTKRRRRGRSWVLGIVILVIVGGGFFLLSTLLSSAEVVVTPLSKEVEVDGTMTIYRDSSEEAGPYFRVIEISDTASTIVEASGTKNVERKASGKIRIFNEFDSNSMKLIKSTRFQAPNGNIYRVLNSVTIPGSRVVNGEVVPGSVEVEVFADKPGEEYNIGIVEFTVPGLKGTPRYEDVYAKSETRMTGGFKGEVFVVEEEDREVAQSELEARLETRLNESMQQEVPEGFKLLSDAASMSLGAVEEEKPNTDTQDENTKRDIALTLEGTIRGVILDIPSFSMSIAERYLEENKYNGEELRITNMDNLIFDVLNEDQLNLESAETLSVKVIGNANLVWNFSEADLKRDLMSTPKDAYHSVLENGYPGIKEARATVSPFWKKSFPDDIKKIDVEIEL